MKARHKRASGGSLKGVTMPDTAPSEVYAGAGSNVVKEAKARKRGGKVEHKIMGGKSRMRLDRPGRKTGGRVGSDKAPLSSAARVTEPPATTKMDD